MNRSARLFRSIVLTSLVLTSCTIPSYQSSSTQSADPTFTADNQSPPSPTIPPAVQAEHRIGVRQVNGVGEFYDKLTDAKFIPRGANYVFVPFGDSVTLWLLSEDNYDPGRTRSDFAKLSSLGYNTVRVFLDQCNRGPGCIGDEDNIGLNPAYLDNIADMMSAGRETGIFIQFTSNDLPDQGGYSEEANSASSETFAGYRNSYYLTPPAINATRRYWRDLLTGLVERNAAFDAVLGWQLLNEQWMFVEQPPLSLTSGIVETTTGSYDMSVPDQKTQMVSDGMVYYIAQMKEEILLHDPTALVTMGFFTPEIAAPGWYVETASLLARSDLDFFDFHYYPGLPPGLQVHAGHFGMIGYEAKPILLGEYGAFRQRYAEIDSAARAMTELLTESCMVGFDGWLYWTYYPSDASAGDGTWGLVEEDYFLLNLFAPVNHSDICETIVIPNDNLAYDKPVTASQSLAEEPPENAVDEIASTSWISGDGPVQWIQVDLLGTYRVAEIRLLVSQFPAGFTTHHLQVRASEEDVFQTVITFDGETNDNDWLIFKPGVPLEIVGQIRVETVSSPSWVSWKEIQVFGETQP